MSVQVVVKLGDRHWDSIRETSDQAFYRISEYMLKDHDPKVARVGDLVKWKLVFGQPCLHIFSEFGFEVETKKLEKQG